MMESFRRPYFRPDSVEVEGCDDEDAMEQKEDATSGRLAADMFRARSYVH